MITETTPLKLLFICRHNTIRSQIAEALANKLGNGKVNAVSAGPEPQEVPDYIQNWANILTGKKQKLQSTPLSERENHSFDLIITLCDKSHKALKTLDNDVEHISWDFYNADSIESVRHLEMEIAKRLRLMLLAKHLI